MKVINLLGHHSLNQSIISAAVFAKLAMNDFKIELMPLYEKSHDNLYILAKQNHLLNELKNKNLDYIINASPLFLRILYNNSEEINQLIFEQLTVELFNKFDNINVCLDFDQSSKNNTTYPIEEIISTNQKIKNKLSEHNIPYTLIKFNNRTTTKIIDLVLKQRMNEII